MKLLNTLRILMGCLILLFAGIGIMFTSIIWHEVVHTIQNPEGAEPQSLCYNYGVSYKDTPVMAHVEWNVTSDYVGEAWKQRSELYAYSFQYIGVGALLVLIYYTGKISGRVKELKNIMDKSK